MPFTSERDYRKIDTTHYGKWLPLAPNMTSCFNITRSISFGRERGSYHSEGKEKTGKGTIKGGSLPSVGIACTLVHVHTLPHKYAHTLDGELSEIKDQFFLFLSRVFLITAL